MTRLIINPDSKIRFIDLETYTINSVRLGILFESKN